MDYTVYQEYIANMQTQPLLTKSDIIECYSNGEQSRGVSNQLYQNILEF